MSSRIWTWLTNSHGAGSCNSTRKINQHVLGLELGTFNGTWERSLVGVSPGTLGDLVIGTWEGSLVSLSLIIPIGSPIESSNCVSVMPVMLLGAPLGLWFVSESFWC